MQALTGRKSKKYSGPVNFRACPYEIMTETAGRFMPVNMSYGWEGAAVYELYVPETVRWPHVLPRNLPGMDLVIISVFTA